MCLLYVLLIDFNEHVGIDYIKIVRNIRFVKYNQKMDVYNIKYNIIVIKYI